MNTDDITLPEIADQRVDEIEAALFAQIAREKDDRASRAERARSRAVRRGRIWMGVAGAAAFVAVAAVIAPQLALSGSAGGAAYSTADQPVRVLPGAADEALTLPESAVGDVAGSADSGVAASGEAGAASDADAREIIATASATVTVDEPREAAEQISDAATAAGGYVEAMSIDGGAPAVDPATGPAMGVDTSLPVSGAWITVRVPADQLSTALAGLSDVGEVTGSQIDRRDVTTEAVDLRARVAALEASVARLTELMGQSASTADLIAAESALADRQAELDSLRQQLTWLESQVGMSTLTVSLVQETPAAEVDPAGFVDGLAAGWKGLVAALGGIVVGIGFLLPWLVVAAAVAAIVWAVRALVRRRRAPHSEG